MPNHAVQDTRRNTTAPPGSGMADATKELSATQYKTHKNARRRLTRTMTFVDAAPSDSHRTSMPLIAVKGFMPTQLA